MKQNKIHQYIRIIIFAAVIYAVFIIYSNFDQTVNIISSFPLVLFVLMLLFAFVNYLIRFVKWEYLLRKIDVRIPFLTSFLCFFSGFSMTLTPAKSGELIKPYLLTRFGHDSGHTTPVVLIERLTDLFGMVILLLISAALLGIGIIPGVIMGIVLILLIVLIQNAKFVSWFRTWMSKSIRISKFLPLLDTILNSTKILSGPAPLLISVLLSCVSWFFECLCLSLALEGLGYPVNIMVSVFIFASSTLAGLLVMIPGGLGATEGLMTVLITAEKIPLDAAVSATLLTRVATLWFAVGLGMVALFVFNAKNKINN
ncbi:YbhN family protein [Methanospirillum stamsii]|uniref:Lysylphosphatidylglycerol synthetase n=1 Tax=Methanospirillum stamsii TaxID=1277351 RepID=A0A2V2MWV4_9EURY|nr:lysylphosphatidylglycerol synthase transmembrane domain-containing protein [Methanospirillum stamsii]PWR71869.1 hypothetical protein DLD82_12680 [Methanospirillum stamsii]